MLIRPEKVQDYAAIAAVQARAFNERPGEALAVALHRQRTEFDPDLSLVAEIEGQIVGHVLFSPYRVVVLRQDVWAVLLAPIGVDPYYQGQGIGSRLIEAGHRIARIKGYAFSMVLGHPSYYPRFGYLTRAYGPSTVTVSTKDLPPSDLISRPLSTEDIPKLYEIWEETEGAVDFALNPGTELLDWLSPNPIMDTTVFITEEENVVGYTRIHKSEPDKPRAFLAQDNAITLRMVAHLSQGTEMTEMVLPLHPNSVSASELKVTSCEAWDAAMVCPLLPSQFEIYYNQVEAGNRLPGRPIWPTAFDLD
jgi:predicted N-acetyltransferase YhbS